MTTNSKPSRKGNTEKPVKGGLNTIFDAREASENDEDYTIEGIIASKSIFFTRRNGVTLRLLTVVIIDADCLSVELKTWSTTKAYTVFNKFHQNDRVQVTGSGKFRRPNDKYSAAEWTIGYRWFLKLVPEPKMASSCVNIDRHAHFHMGPGATCTQITIEDYFLGEIKPANIIARFYDLVKGPNHFAAQGYYLKLTDMDNRLFQVLVWINHKLDRKNLLAKCTRDDLIFICSAREQDERFAKSTPPPPYCLTTTYPPAINPKFLCSHMYNLFKPKHSGGDAVTTFHPDKVYIL